MSTSSNLPQTGRSAAKAVSTPNKKPSSKCYKETVTLVVGAAKEDYILHEDLLCFYSDFFRAAFKGSFKEATERKIEVPEVEADVFEAFQVWLYTQCIPKNEISPTKTYPEWPILIKLWVFGDGHQIPLLQKNVMNAIFEKVEKDQEIPAQWMHHAYENTTAKSHLRRAVTDIIAYRALMNDTAGVDISFAKAVHGWSSQICLDLIAEMDRGWRSNAVRCILPKKAKCYYHVHAEGEQC